MSSSSSQAAQSSAVPEGSENLQVNTMCNLALLQFLRTRKPAPEPKAPDLSKTEQDIMRLLNWIASVFVREGKGDVVAAAFSATPGKFTLYLAANRGIPEEQDIQNTLRFSSLLREAMRSYCDRPQSLLYKPLIDWVLEVTSVRFMRKLAALPEMRLLTRGPNGDRKPPASRFEELVRKWAASPSATSEDQRVIDNLRCISGAPAFKGFPEVVGDPTGTSLIFVFAALLRLITKRCRQVSAKYVLGRNSSEEGMRFASIVGELLRTKFFEAITDTALECFSLAEHFWLCKLKRRLGRIACYLGDASLLARVAFPKFQEALQGDLAKFFETGEGFEIVWVGAERGVLPVPYVKDTYGWPEKPSKYFEHLLELYTTQADMVDVLADEDFTRDLNEFSEKALKILLAPRLHCEIQLINYLLNSRITVVMHTIGVSKLMCFACAEYIRDRVQSDETVRSWKFPHCSLKYHHAWLIPADQWGTKVAQTIQAKLAVELRHLAAQSRQRANSGGSDSSGGLRSDDSDEEVRKMSEMCFEDLASEQP